MLIMKRKTWALLTLGALLLSLVLIAALVAFIDPFQIYHLAENFIPPIDNNTQVYSNAGIARSYDYDSAVVGTSVTENFRPKQMDQVLDGRFIKLCSSGGTAYNHAILMDLAFRTHDIKRIVYGFDVYSFTARLDETKFDMPYYLYDDNLFNDVSYWFNISVLGTYIPRCLETWGQKPDEQVRYKMYEWVDQYIFGPHMLEQASFTPPESRRAADAYLDIARANIETHLLPYIQAHPETRFDIFFPPYSAAEWATMESKGTFDGLLALRGLCYDMLSGCGNVFLYDFAAETDWVFFSDLYKDPLHYNQWVNDMMVEQIAAGENLITDAAQLAANDAAIRSWVSAQMEAGGWVFYQ